MSNPFHQCLHAGWCLWHICAVPHLRPLTGCIFSPPLLCSQVLNETFSSELREYLSPHFSLDDASFISIDATGADVRVRLGNEFNVERLGFETKVSNVDEAIVAVRQVLLEC